MACEKQSTFYHQRMNSNMIYKQQVFSAFVDNQNKPLLKWAGGKFRVLHQILHHLPQGIRLIEPFAGSAAVSINSNFSKKLVADINSDLINLYSNIKIDHDTFIREAFGLFTEEYNHEDAYYRLRTEFNESLDSFQRSIIFIYLNKHSFNGLCRYNSKGKFNVPFGKYKKPYFPKKEIINFAQLSKSMEFKHQSFLDTMSMGVKGDVIYCDPPYLPLSETANFTSYASTSFGSDEQESLAEAARRCATKGVPVVISNHDTPKSRALYKGAELHTFEVRRFISSKASTRGNAPELLAIFR